MLQGGEKCACILLEKMDIGQSTLSHHMKILCESGIVSSRREGKWTHYSIRNKGSEYAKELLTTLTTVYSDQNNGITANRLVAVIGTVMPFFPAHPSLYLIGFTGAGLLVCVTFSFLISSPLADLDSYF